MMNPDNILERSRSSSFYLWLFNLILYRTIPFNKPHRLKVVRITENSLKVKLPYIRKNQNHLKGMHACALATLAEFTCGVGMLNLLGANKYRLIMKDLKIAYHIQGKSTCFAEIQLDKQKLIAELESSLKQSDSLFKSFEIDVFDLSEHKICTATVNWQIKPWNKIKKK